MNNINLKKLLNEARADAKISHNAKIQIITSLIEQYAQEKIALSRYYTNSEKTYGADICSIDTIVYTLQHASWQRADVVEAAKEAGYIVQNGQFIKFKRDGSGTQP